MIHARAAKGPLQVIVFGLSLEDLDDLREGNIMISTGGGLSVSLMVEASQERLDKFLRAAISEAHRWNSAPPPDRHCLDCDISEMAIGASKPCPKGTI